MMQSFWQEGSITTGILPTHNTSLSLLTVDSKIHLFDFPSTTKTIDYTLFLGHISIFFWYINCIDLPTIKQYNRIERIVEEQSGKRRNTVRPSDSISPDSEAPVPPQDPSVAHQDRRL